MKFKSALVTAASGSIGGLVASHNAGGQYLRARTIPVDAATYYQQQVRNMMAQVSAAWQNTLTPEQRAAWSAYADQVPLLDRLGDSRPVSGISMYCRCNVPRLQAGLARIDDGPEVFALPDFTAPTFAADVSDNEVEVTFTNTDDWAGEVGGGMLVYCAAARPLSINYFKGPYRFMGLIAGAVVPPASPAAQTPPFPLIAGLNTYLAVRVCRADGRLSSLFRGVCQPVA